MIDLSGVSPHTALGRFMRLPLRLLPRGRSVPILQGPMRGMRWTIGAGTHGCWLGTFEWHKQQAFAAAVQPGQVVCDLGANAGVFTLLAARNVTASGRVIAFEPLPANVRVLRRHVELNRLEQVVEVIEAAVSDRSGSARLSLGPDPSMARLHEGSDGATVDVRLVVLDELWGSGAMPMPDHIKIDVEGAELAVLRGAAELLRTGMPRIWLATHGEEIRDQCLDLLRGLGYDVLPLRAGGEASDDEFVAIAAAGAR